MACYGSAVLETNVQFLGYFSCRICGGECNVFAIVAPAAWAIRDFGFLLQNVLTRYRDHPVSCLMDTGSFLPLELSVITFIAEIENRWSHASVPVYLYGAYSDDLTFYFTSIECKLGT